MQFEYLRNIVFVIEFYIKFLIFASFRLSNYILNCIYQIKKIKNDKFILFLLVNKQ